MAAAKNRELFEVFRPSDDGQRKEEGPRKEEPAPAKPRPSRSERKTLWEERASAGPGQVSFSLGRATILFAGIVGILLIAISYGLGLRNGRMKAAAENRPAPVVKVAAPAPTALPAPKPSEPPKPAAITQGYAVQLVSYRKRADADTVFAALRAAGFSTLSTGESGDYIGVCVGLYATREEALKVQQWFKTNKVDGKGPFADALVIRAEAK